MSKVKVGIYTLWHFDTYGQPMSFDEMVDYLHNDGTELYVNVYLSNPKPMCTDVSVRPSVSKYPPQQIKLDDKQLFVLIPLYIHQTR